MRQKHRAVNLESASRTQRGGVSCSGVRWATFSHIPASLCNMAPSAPVAIAPVCCFSPASYCPLDGVCGLSTELLLLLCLHMFAVVTGVA